jgi:hypothetical protein
MGREEWLKPLFSVCVKVTRNRKKIELVNQSGIEFDLEGNSGETPKSIHLITKGSMTISTAKPLKLIVKNFETAPGKNLEVVIE